ncbi:MAG: U32 family peptidase [Muribaculaceae bacterium]|nr:U32 family peptidase [Muribaculaceae bacterium]
MREIELLAPAANADIAIEAIRHGADAVYIGGPGYGARKNAANSIEDIRRVVDFAHIFRAKVYVTVNTIVYQSELMSVERMIYDLYRIGVDALIVQDMGILRLQIPPIALHASTQCDTRDVAKAKFLEAVGFSQIVLARELTLTEIRDICDAVTIPVECFVHGALCVSYSGRCHTSCFTTGRSANRGECAQICRLPFTLRDADNKILADNCHLLSLKDLNTLDILDQLLDAGVSSFKIEGRLKDMDYVKNVTAAYSQRLNNIISQYPDKYKRSSQGNSIIEFTPQLDKSFNRGFTHYFLEDRRPSNISQPATPKSMGEVIEDISTLNNGDGISYFTSGGEYKGVMVNGIKGNKIIGNRPFILPKGAKIHRTYDRMWQSILAKKSAERRLSLDISINRHFVTARDERGVEVTVPLNCRIEKARKPMNFRSYFNKLGNTEFQLHNFECSLSDTEFIKASDLTKLKHDIISTLRSTARATYRYDYRRSEDLNYEYPDKILTYRDNVANPLAETFFHDHGVKKIESAMEIGINPSHDRLMTTRHCILREQGWCLKNKDRKKINLPLSLISGNMRFRLAFDCVRCEMHVLRR